MSSKSFLDAADVLFAIQEDVGGYIDDLEKVCDEHLHIPSNLASERLRLLSLMTSLRVVGKEVSQAVIAVGLIHTEIPLERPHVGKTSITPFSIYARARSRFLGAGRNCASEGCRCEAERAQQFCALHSTAEDLAAGMNLRADFSRLTNECVANLQRAVAAVKGE
jgi:hypothetical protein